MLDIPSTTDVKNAGAGSASAREKAAVEAATLIGYRDDLNAPLAAFESGAAGHSFHAWVGRSRQRYIFSVCPPEGFDRDLLRTAVVIACTVGSTGRRIVYLGEGGDVPDALAERPSIELHYHLLATTPRARRLVIADLLG